MLENMKNNKIESVVQEWVQELPFMQQALLMTAVRGPDGISKNAPAKDIVRYLRGAILNPAGNITGNEDSFMWIDYSAFNFYNGEFFKDIDFYPMHFLMHLFHSAEVLGYKHPDSDVSDNWLYFYGQACRSFHMYPESEEDMNRRMNI